jgi:hypothetical protein
MTMFEKRSTGTTHNDHDSHRDHDNRPRWDSHWQRTGLTAAEEVMSRWTGAFYDYADAPEGSPTGCWAQVHRCVMWPRT